MNPLLTKSTTCTSDTTKLAGIGFQCRCGITVLSGVLVKPETLRLCTACTQDKADPAGWVQRRTVQPSPYGSRP